jgi:hypothetical protein
MTTIQEQVIDMLVKRLNYNVQQRQAAANRGDIAEVSRLDADTASTNELLNLLRNQIGE